ncbi:MAG: fibronectin type III domain-containing protein [Candidatus Nanopelagicales bacterium]
MRTPILLSTFAVGAVAALGATALAAPASADSDYSDATQQLLDMTHAVGTPKPAPRKLTAPIAQATGQDTRSAGGQATLTAEPGYWVFDTIVDGYDTGMNTELLGSGLSIEKDYPTDMVLMGIASGSTAASDQFGVLIDSTGDGTPDYGAASDGAMARDVVYGAPLFRFTSNGQAEPTGRFVQMVRIIDGYAVNIAGWREAGLTNISYATFIDDGVETDYAPDAFAPRIPVGTMVPATPTQTAAPGKVTGVKVAAKRTKAKVRWGAAKGATSYRVLVKGSSSHRSWKATTRTSAKVSGLRAGKSYTVRVKARAGSTDGAIVTKKFRTKKK